MQIVTVPVRPWFPWNHLRPVRSTQILILHCPSWESCEPWLKPTHVGGLWLSTLASVALGQFLDHPPVLGMLFWSLVSPPGCGPLLFSYVLHSPAPPSWASIWGSYLMGDVQKGKVTYNAETQLQVEPRTS